MQIRELEYIINLSADHHHAKLQSSLRYKCIRAPQSYRLCPDSSLKNLWEEICVQVQSDKWEGFFLVEHFLIGQIAILIDKLPIYVKYCLSYEFVMDEEEASIYLDAVNEKILEDFYETAMNFSSPRIEKFLFG